MEHDSNAKLQGYQYAELAALVRYRHQPGNPAIARVLARDRDVHLTLDIRLQLRAKEILEQRLREAGTRERRRGRDGLRHRRRAGDGQRARARSAGQSAPRRPRPTNCSTARATANTRRAPRSSWSPPSPPCAAIPTLTHRTFLCRTLSDGRAGNVIAGWNRPIKDDIGDHAHGTLDMERAIAVSCNAYFAQLGVHDVGSQGARGDRRANGNLDRRRCRSCASRCRSPRTARARC